MRDSMVFYRSFAKAIKRLPAEEQLKALWSIINYSLDEVEPEEDGLFMMIFDMAKPQIDANIKRKNDGCKGGRPSKTTGSENTETMETTGFVNEETTGYANQKPNVNENVNANENVNVNDNTKTMCTADADALFERLWDEYPVKKGKGQVSAAQKKRLLAVGEAALMKAIERYRAELDKDSDWRKAQNGSTFFNSGYVDYLDENFVPDKFRAPKKQDTSGNKFCNFTQRETDYEALMMDQVHGWLDQAKGA